MQKGRQSMFKLIKNGQVVTDQCKTLTLAEGDTPQSVKLPVGPVLVPLSVWQAADESAKEIGRDIDDFTVIAVEFDKFSDGNSYSTARLLRERYGYKGELRAIGDVPRDKLTYQHQVGFDAFRS